MLDNRKILVVDDNRWIHKDIGKALASWPHYAEEPTSVSGVLPNDVLPSDVLPNDVLPSDVLPNDVLPSDVLQTYDIDYATQGQEAFEMVCDAVEKNTPYSLVIVDMHMPPGWDGIKTLENLWQVDSALYAILLLPFVDDTHDKVLDRLGASEYLVFLRKPFDPLEISQLVYAQCSQWNLQRESSLMRKELQKRVLERTDELEKTQSHLLHANEKLTDAKNRAEAAVAMKSEILANISHEIRTPMNGLMGMVDLLRQTALNKDQQEYLDAITASSESLLHIVTKMLDFSHIDQGSMSLKFSSFSPHELVEQVVQILKPKAFKKELACNYIVADNVPKQVVGDVERVKQVLANLLDNAIKFTSQGGVTIKLTAVSHKRHAVVLEFEVSDTGIGIDELVMPHLFNPFTQGDGSFTREYGGAGLGLAISKQLVELMGGKINFNSVIGTGSTFSFTIHCRLPKDVPPFVMPLSLSLNH